jgi:hypothetical protein
MKRILSAALVSLALIGNVSTASAIEVPDQNAPLQEHLKFWQLFNGNGSGTHSVS